ncbi:TraG family conjugative transposon ATPase [Chitinophaga sp. 22321]|uniref:TraG family conjugative transposon ATPase n=1 Tax=Chitinophaga sp. 22321 TaxID=3453909 RepID=UPI003F877262
MKQKKNLENVLPIYKVEDDFIISKQGDLTIAFSVTLPEIFTLAIGDYEALHQSLLKAIRVLPDFTILHKQDWFCEDKFQPGIADPDESFLTAASNRHFFERPFLAHECFIFLTRIANTTKEPTTLSSTLIRNSIVPPATLDQKEIQYFEDKAGQFAQILQDSAYVSLRRLQNDELASTEKRAGLIERYCFLQGGQEQPSVTDIQIDNESLKIGSKALQIFSLSDVEDLPALTGPRVNFDKYSTDKTRFSVGFASPLAQLLNCNHLYNQYIIVGNAQATIKKMESKRRRLQSLSSYSRENTISRDATNAYLNEAVAKGRLPIQAHFNIIAWSDDPAQTRPIKNMVSAAIASLNGIPKLETASAAQLFWSALPGNSAELPNSARFSTFAEQASCFFSVETNYRTSLSATGLRLGDRISGLPLNVDIFQEPFERNIIQNRNIFLCGPSGSGKSFATNHLLRSCWEEGGHVVVVDVGHSYKGLCDLAQGYYFTYSETDPLKFNPFYFTGDLDTEKKESIKALLLALWKREDETYTRSEYVSLSNALQSYFNYLKLNESVFPCFNTFYDYLQNIFSPELRAQGIKEKIFDVDNFLYVLKPYYGDGEYSYLLNATENLNLLDQSFIVFELDNIKENEILLAVTTLIVTSTFISKMRKLHGKRKIILIEEAWKAIARAGMAEYIKYLFKTVRKFWGTACVVTQEVNDIISSTIIKDSIINNSDIKILLDQSKYMNKFQDVQDLLGLTEKDKTLILSMNRANDPKLKYKEIFISLGGSVSKVYRTEVSLEEYLTYTTEQKEKVLVQEYAKKYGSIKRGISMLAADIRQHKI